MTTDKRRRAERRKAGFPVKLLTPEGYLHAHVRDVSRTGVRLRLDPASAELGPFADAAAADAALRKLLPRPFSITLEYERLGPLIQKIATLRRVGLPEDGGGAIDVCCSFGKCLENDELELLALQLPPLEEDVEAWREADADRPTLDDLIAAAPKLEDHREPLPRQTYRASLAAAGERTQASLFCETDLLTAYAVRVRIARESALGAACAHLHTATTAGRAFMKRFGKEVDLQIFDSCGEIWSGRLQVSGFELSRAHAGDLLISLSFGRRLHLREMRKLGLAQSS